MSENETGGMLRNVIVLSLIAMIAGVAATLVFTLKGSYAHNSLLAEDASTNQVALNGLSYGEAFTGFNKTKLIDHPEDSSLLLRFDATDTSAVGMVDERKDDGHQNIRDKFKPSDNWRMGFDMKTATPGNVTFYKDDKHQAGVGLEASTVKWLEKPEFSTEYQHYELEGHKDVDWGTFVMYFKKINGNLPASVQIKDIELYRVP